MVLEDGLGRMALVDAGINGENVVRDYLDEHRACAVWVSHDRAQRQRVAPRVCCPSAETGGRGIRTTNSAPTANRHG